MNLDSQIKWYATIKSGEAIQSELVNDTDSIKVIGGNGVMGYSNKSNFHEEVIVVGRVGALCGNVHHVTGKSWITDNALVITDFRNIFPRYLYYSLTSKELNRFASKTAQPLITGTLVKNQKIRILNISEQHRIANFLDHKTAQLDSLISSKEQQISLLNEYKQSLISETVTKGLNPNVPMKESGVEPIGLIPKHWIISKSKNYIEFIKGTSINEEDMNYDGDGIQFLRTNDLYEGSKITKEPMYFKGDLSSFPIKTKEDYLICFDGFNTQLGKGTVGMFTKKGEGVFSSHMYLIRNKNENMMKRFAEYSIGSTPSLLQAITNIKGAISYSCGYYKNNISITVPPLEEQKQMVEFLDHKVSQIDSLTIQIQAEIEKIKEYKQSLIFEAVTGKYEIKECR